MRVEIMMCLNSQDIEPMCITWLNLCCLKCLVGPNVKPFAIGWAYPRPIWLESIQLYLVQIKTTVG